MIVVKGTWLSEPRAQAVFHALETAGHRAFAVGGCVRNALLGAPVEDLDIATDALPDETIAAVESAGLKAVPTGKEHGTITVVSDGEGYEVTTFRADMETDGRRATVRFSQDLTEDARRRDFTINALYADKSGRVTAPLGSEQLEDLSARRVRFIGQAEDRIREDYLRILRYFRFSAWYGDPEAGFDPDELAAIAECLDGLEILSRERVGAETKKLLTAQDPARAVAAMAQVGVLTRVLLGADPRALGPLVELEEAAGIRPDPLRRLVAMGVSHDPGLRLSKKEVRRIETLVAAIADGGNNAALGYKYGSDTAKDALLVRHASLGMPLGPEALNAIDRGAQMVFPINAADLMPGLSGAALGEALSALEAEWIASDFNLTREDLLDRAKRA
ncbi:CCA tRNA nucleotidyltransferase [Roseivivax sp. THAF30]|uniref:CCA tRNA nucleotidyltransferase n=1 Tax=Roseivivax sp. THAF30 TaxID=2587852 RepID=UPI0012681ED0|nr:CCA tRNA nucleotidyltransferase [Roseivivax sp. THAF30]QFT64889.1 CCA-adding enzyme [Roseivivax sp. THAF30]